MKNTRAGGTEHEGLKNVGRRDAGTAAYNVINPTGLVPSYTLNGVGYGLLAFEQNGQGRPVPRTIRNRAR